MTKFEQVGVTYQYEATNTQEAIKSFSNSCDCCCTKGIHLDCDRCAISAAHKHIVAYFDGK